MNDEQTVIDRLTAELRTHPPGTPVAAGSLARRLGCATTDVIAAGDQLQSREQGDEDLFTVVHRIGPEGDHEVFLSWVPLTLNDEPEHERRRDSLPPRR